MSTSSPAHASGDAFTFQLLHASDLEGGVDAIDRAANFAAIVDHFQGTMSNTLTLSAGDNVIPGPFFNAALFTDAAVFNTAANALFGLTSDEMYAALEGARGRIDMAIMNAIGFDASALGNHEFDLATDTMADYIRPSLGGEGLADDEWLGTTFPYLSANLDFSADGSLSGTATTDILDMSTYVHGGPTESAAGTESPRIAPGALFTVGGELIGVVGATTPMLDTISSTGDVVVAAGDNNMTALAAILQPVIDQMIAAGSNKIILTSHLQQIALEKELVGLLHGVDIIVAGGSDTLLADETDTLRPGDVAAETYPYVTTNADGDAAVIVSTDGEYSYVGRLVVGFDENGVLNPDSISAADSGAYASTDAMVSSLYGSTDAAFTEGSPGDQVRELVAGVEAIVTAQDGTLTGTTDVFLEGRRAQVRTQETNLGDLTADANLALAKSYDSSVMVSIKNGGGIRAQIGEVESDGTLVAPQGNADAGKDVGDVSQLDIVNALRFNNGLALQTITQEQLVQVLEHGVAESGEGATPGQFAQVAGVRYSYDTSLEAGSRIVNAAIVDDNGTVVTVLVANGQFVGDANGTVRVVGLDFLVENGGDSFPFPTFAEALGAETANVVNLGDVLTDAGTSTFADPGSEQDALAEYLIANHPDGRAYAGVDTDASGDLRIQNLDARDDAVFGTKSWFDDALYLATNDDVAAAVRAGAFANGAQHYALYGWAEGRDPNAFFDTSFYLANNADVAEAGVNPFEHYALYGWREGRDPSAAFDTSAYLDANADVADAAVNPLQHLMGYGMGEGRYTDDIATP
ncbi:bifunctional metallophosphatase/5'-nucleotidase [Roseospira marina]|uniref:Bifunctional metallophosphatase/5'-nucleotidase n=1 Tax=Roseospira marina TaxID=140057 RepID=A0A5M6IBE9_9PROT|nr:bifunctional metallophosphatase/5'-nucleotidase [Roseospira marina]KAA5605620.1 bifunctional metallophosphatase/5'-nucleotidase [Roseospira marina]MBB4313309.1 2',3'-cyclic-nucleotide 2'-phosphodiesterase (5'-nucleotidase family) [Roseospira marina]MBB5085950.1 2',3'-cyclic-nucleotide 2'-phosphodiesterase (5'-nucleotidase family) [Roseospira marina]